MQRINKLAFYSLAFTPLITLSADNEYRAIVTTSFLYLAYAIAFIGGLWALKTAIDGFANYQEETQRGEGTAGKKIVLRFLVAGVLLNPEASIETTMNTLKLTGGDNGLSYCYAYDPSFLGDLQTNRNKDIKNGSNGLIETSSLVQASKVPDCMDEPTTIAQKLLKQNTDSDSKGIFGKIQGHEDIQFLIAILQVIATFFYFNAWFTIWSIADGKDRQATYKGQVLTILFSAFVINLPATITVLANSANKLLG